MSLGRGECSLVMYQRSIRAIPRDMLQELFMPRRTKVALALGLCPDCWWG